MMMLVKMVLMLVLYVAGIMLAEQLDPGRTWHFLAGWLTACAAIILNHAIIDYQYRATRRRRQRLKVIYDKDAERRAQLLEQMNREGQ